MGIVTVPDARVDYLAEKYHSKKVIPAAIEFVDIAGLVKGASKGEGLGNQFLANIREVDAIVHVVRCFDDGNIVHVDGSVNPLRDIETINFELIFSDIEVLDRRIAKSTKGSRNDKSLAHEVEFLSKVKAHLEDGKLAKTFEVDDEEDQEIVCLVRKALDSLSEQQRKIVEMHVMEGKKYLEIAESLNLSENTIRTHLKRAYKILRENLSCLLPGIF